MRTAVNNNSTGEIILLVIIQLTGEGNGYPSQYSCWENSMDRGAWQATVHGVAKSQTRLKQLSTHTEKAKKLEIQFLLQQYS